MRREDLIELLESYKENKAKLNMRLKDLKIARIKLKSLKKIDVSLSVTYGLNQEIHSKNKISSKVEKQVEKNDIKKRELKEEINNLEEVVKELRNKVESVDDRLIGLKYKEREILTAYYIDGRTAEDIGNNLYFKLFYQKRTERNIQRIVEKATNKMLEL